MKNALYSLDNITHQGEYFEVRTGNT